MPENPVADVDAAYVAGLLDSDGYICVSRSGVGVYPRVGIHQVDPEAVDFVAELFGGSPRLTPPSSELSRRDQYRLIYNNSAAVPVLKAVLPFLRIKKRQAELALRAAELNRWREAGLDFTYEGDGSDLVPLAEAATLVGKSYGAAKVAVQEGRVPSVRRRCGPGHPRVFIPRDALAEWAARPWGGRTRPAEVTAELAALADRMMSLNRREVQV